MLAYDVTINKQTSVTSFMSVERIHGTSAHSSASGPSYALHMVFVVRLKIHRRPKALNMHWCCVDMLCLLQQTLAPHTNVFVCVCEYHFCSLRHRATYKRHSNRSTDCICILSIVLFFIPLYLSFFLAVSFFPVSFFTLLSIALWQTVG